MSEESSVVEAKEVNGQPVAEERSAAGLSPPEDQIAMESIDRSHGVYVPPPVNLIQGKIPVPVSIAAKPGSLVLPGLPRRRQGHRQKRPRRPPHPIHKKPPHKVHTNYAPPPALGKVQRPHARRVSPAFLPPPPLPNGFALPPRQPHPSAIPHSHQVAHGSVDFGNPKSNDLIEKSESALSTVYTAPFGPAPHVPPQQSPLQHGPPQHGSPQHGPPQHGPLQHGPPQHGPHLNMDLLQHGPPPHSPPPHGLPPQGSLHGVAHGPPLPLAQNAPVPVSHELSILYGGPVSAPHGVPQAPHPISSDPVEGYVPPVLPESRKPIVAPHDAFGAGSGLGGAYVPPSGHSAGVESWPVTSPEMPQIVALDVKCEKNLMKVRIEFDKPFNGIIFSKGHYSNAHCVHLPAGLGRTHSTFDVSINSCGTTGNTENGLYGYGSQSGSGTFFENTIVIQYDPQVQEVWDGARKLRCTWHDQYEKSVTFRPFSVDMLDVVRADFAGDNVGCWMQIQVGKGPWASEVSGLVKIGQTMTMVLAIKDDDNKFDMLVRNCMAHDGKRAPIQLVDQRGCITRQKLMSRFTKIKDFGASASVLSYAHFQAFKFPDSMEVHFQCTIQICRYQCPEQCSGDLGAGGYSGHPREKREVSDGSEDSPSEREAGVGVNRVIQVVSTRDLTFILDKNGVEEAKEVTKETLIESEYDEHDGLICMSTPGFAAILVVLLGILIVSCLLSAFLCMRLRLTPSARPFISASFDNPAFLRKPGCFEYQ